MLKKLLTLSLVAVILSVSAFAAPAPIAPIESVLADEGLPASFEVNMDNAVIGDSGLGGSVALAVTSEQAYPEAIVITVVLDGASILAVSIQDAALEMGSTSVDINLPAAQTEANDSYDVKFYLWERKTTLIPIAQPVEVTVTPASETPRIWSGQAATEEPEIVDGAYQIANGEDLAWFANAVKTTPNLNAKLVSNIYMNEGTSDNWYETEANVETAHNWSDFMIGTSSVPYTGTFDGNGKTIYNLYLNGNSVGLFGVANGATIKKVTVANSYVVSTQNDNGQYVSLLCFTAKNGTTIQDCSTSGKMVPSSSITRLVATGSIVGILDGSTVTGCSSSAVIDSTGGKSTGSTNSANGFGGIAGRVANNASTISYCSFTGTLNNAAAGTPGPILGRASKNVTITGCTYDTKTYTQPYGYKATAATVTIN